MGQKQTKAQRIADLEKWLAEANTEIDAQEERQEGAERDLRTARADLNRYKEAERHQKLLADRKAAEARRENERQALEDLSNGIIHLDRFEGTRFAFTYDPSGPEAEITLILDERQAKILNAYATAMRKDEPGTTYANFSIDTSRFVKEIDQLALAMGSVWRGL